MRRGAVPRPTPTSPSRRRSDGIVESFRPVCIVEGRDFRFGRDRAGDLDRLRELGTSRGFTVIEVDEVHAPFEGEAVAVHSGVIRSLIREGLVGRAAFLLQRAYAIEGTVVSGDRRGRELGYPTANVDHGEFLLPADGIYAGTACGPSGRLHRAAISVGTAHLRGDATGLRSPPAGLRRSRRGLRMVHLGPLRAGCVRRSPTGIEPLLEQLRTDLEETRRRVELPTDPIESTA